MSAGEQRSTGAFLVDDTPPLRVPQEDLDKQRDLALRRGYLQIIDAIERRWGISPTTAELRKLSP